MVRARRYRDLGVPDVLAMHLRPEITNDEFIVVRGLQAAAGSDEDLDKVVEVTVDEPSSQILDRPSRQVHPVPARQLEKHGRLDRPLQMDV